MPRYPPAIPVAFALSLALAIPTPATGQTPPAPASQLITKAQAAGKPVFVAFHASWCGWCRRLEALLERPALKPIFDRHFTTVWLTIMESDKARPNNPGAEDLYRSWSGGTGGIPFYAVLDGQGKVLASSILALSPGAKPANIGYPSTAEEIKAFVTLLRAADPKLTEAEAALILKELEAAAPKGR